MSGLQTKNMFRTWVSIIIISLFFYGCSKEKDEKTDAPAAIKELILSYTNCTCDPYIDKYFWRDKIVYLSGCRGPACDCIAVYYDKNGEKLNMSSGYTPDNFLQESQFVKNIWSCKEK